MGCNPQVPIVVNLDVMLARLEWPPGDLLAFEGETVRNPEVSSRTQSR